MKSSVLFRILLFIAGVFFVAAYYSLPKSVIYVVFGLLVALVGYIAVKRVREGIGPANLEEIDEWYRLAFKKNDTDALLDLVELYSEGDCKQFFDKHPKQAKEVFEAALRWVELVETKQIDKEAEFEDYYYLALMYEEGFSVVPNLELAAQYYQKALSTSSCWTGNPEYYKTLRQKVQQRLTNLTQAQ